LDEKKGGGYPRRDPKKGRDEKKKVDQREQPGDAWGQGTGAQLKKGDGTKGNKLRSHS